MLPVVILMALAYSAGCRAGRDETGLRVDRAWEAAQQHPPSASQTLQATNPPPAVDTPAGDVIALVDGQPIPRDRIVDLLLAGHGPGILEQIVVLEAAKRLAAERRLTVTEADVEAEYTRSLKQLASALPAAEPDVFDRKAGEAILADILSRRNICRREYRMAMKRNAYFRKIVSGQLQFTDEQLHEEFDHACGQRVEVRYIQLADLPQAHDARRQLDAGADFAELARRISANPTSARTGGLLQPFTEDDPDVPGVIRGVAFALKNGDVSNPIRVGAWYHILRRDRTLPARQVDFAAVRDELEQRLRARMTTPAMQQLYRTLYEQADITVYDPVLRAAVEQKRAGADSQTANQAAEGPGNASSTVVGQPETHPRTLGPSNP